MEIPRQPVLCTGRAAASGLTWSGSIEPPHSTEARIGQEEGRFLIRACGFWDGLAVQRNRLGVTPTSRLKWRVKCP